MSNAEERAKEVLINLYRTWLSSVNPGGNVMPADIESFIKFLDTHHNKIADRSWNHATAISEYTAWKSTRSNLVRNIFAIVLLLVVSVGGFVLFRNNLTPSETEANGSTPVPATSIALDPTASPTTLIETATPVECIQSTVVVGNSCMDIYEVSNADYAGCVAEGGCEELTYRKPSWLLGTDEFYYGEPEYSSHPVVLISWDQANVYCESRGKRLPTAAEWDEAVSQLSSSFPPQPSEIPLAVSDDRLDRTENGIYGLGGNVKEWVADGSNVDMQIKGQDFTLADDDLTAVEYDIASGIGHNRGFRCSVSLGSG